MHNTDVDIDNNVETSTLICRGCLKTSGDMKSIYESGLEEDFFKYTDVLKFPTEGMPHHLCKKCEVSLKNTKRFKIRCQESDKTLRSNIEKKNSYQSQVKIMSEIVHMKLIFRITAPNPEDTIILKCPHKTCCSEFAKKQLLITHLRKGHNISENFEVEQQFYCTEAGCIYNLTSGQNKYFTGRKNLNQHYTKIHKDKIHCCETCYSKFSKLTDYFRHRKSCNKSYDCEACSQTYSTKETYMVHLLRRHPELHAKYKKEKKTQKRLHEKELEEDIETPIKMMKDNDTEPHKREFPPLQLNIDILESTIPPINYIIETGSIVDIQTTVVDHLPSNDEESVLIDNTEELCADDMPVAEDYTIEEVSVDEEIITENVYIADNPIEEEPLDRITEEPLDPVTEEPINHVTEESLDPVAEECIIEESSCEEASNEIDALKKTSATQIPEDLTNDVSLTAWSNKNDLEFQNEMSTQTVFEDLLAMKSQHGEDEIFFSESVSLSDIQTQTAPLLSRCNKETQFCTSQTQSPDLSIKETQTCICLQDSPKHNFRLFDSFSSNNFISTETQTTDFRMLIRSDVLLSFSSAETQTSFDEASSM